jgi:hypothetical protein
MQRRSVLVAASDAPPVPRSGATADELARLDAAIRHDD